MELPEGWKFLTIADIGKVKGGKRLPKGETYSEVKTKFPYLRVTDFDKLTIKQNNLKYLSAGTQSQIKNYTISNSDVFISIAGTIGQVGVIPNILDGANLTENAAKITDLKEVYNLYLAYVLSSQTAQAQIKRHTIATTQPKLSLFRIEKIIIPCPSVNEQHQIVDKIEELFSELDKGIENLKTAQQQLKVYRQAVLKWAFEGKLTNENVKEGELPEGWEMTTIGTHVNCIVPNRDKPKTFSGNIPWLTTPSLPSELINVDYSKLKLGLTVEEASSYKAKIIPINSVVMTCVGTFGIAVVLAKKAIINQQLHAFLPSETFLPKYLAYDIKNQKHYCEKTATTTTIAYLNKTNCNSIPIPLCSIEEQRKIVEEIETRLSVCDKIEETITNNLTQAEALRQSILKRAFEGKLVKKGG